MTQYRIRTIDLKFQGVPRVIASYLIEHHAGAVLVECGPGSTVAALVSGLNSYGWQPESISDLLLTHIHLDHAGAAGWLASRGVRVHVHHRGAPHLVDPQRLVSSARRIYGEDMERLWGEILPVPTSLVHPLEDDDLIDCHGLQFRALNTPGHANHHMAYLLGETCFSGDVGGVRLPSQGAVELPMPPPELHLGVWKESLSRLAQEPMAAIAPTHFGLYENVNEHLRQAGVRLEEVSQWLTSATQDAPDALTFQARFEKWRLGTSQSAGVTGEQAENQQLVNPAYMSAQGLYRYWRKFLGGEATTSRLVV